MNVRLRYLIVVLFLGFVLLPDSAEARRRGLPLVIINTGTNIAKVADLPPELAADPELAGWALGYKYERFGILWADVWTWEKELVIFKDDTYSELPEGVRTAFEAQHSFSDSDRNLWNRFGILLMVGGIVGYGFLNRGDGEIA
jgi:hypothetical protein